MDFKSPLYASAHSVCHYCEADLGQNKRSPTRKFGYRPGWGSARVLSILATVALLFGACENSTRSEKANDEPTAAASFKRIYQAADSLANKDPERAIALADSALLLLEGQDLPGLRWKACGLKGNALRSLDRYDEALEWLSQSYDLAVEEGNVESKITASLNLGALYLVQKKHNEALEYFTAARNALALDSTTQLKRIKTMLCSNIGSVYKSTNRLQDAIREYHGGWNCASNMASRNTNGFFTTISA